MKSAITVTCCLLLFGLAPAPAAPKQGQARGQKQMEGILGQFGHIYTLQNDFNLQLISARYTLEPHADYAGTAPTHEEKLLVIRYALKNARDSDNYTAGLEFTAVDDNEKSYTNGSGDTRFGPAPFTEWSATLKPGQGVGQDAAKPLTVALRIPNAARIDKILVNVGRKGRPSEKVLRYVITAIPGPGMSDNVIAPLPAYVADTRGDVARDVADAVPNTYMPGTYFALRCDGVSYPADLTYGGRQAADGKRFAVATMSARLIGKPGTSTYYMQDNAAELVEARDTNGERYKATDGPWRASADEALPSTECQAGDEIKFRYVFEIPKEAQLTSVKFGGGTLGHAYLLKL